MYYEVNAMYDFTVAPCRGESILQIHMKDTNALSALSLAWQELSTGAFRGALHHRIRRGSSSSKVLYFKCGNM